MYFCDQENDKIAWMQNVLTAITVQLLKLFRWKLLLIKIWIFLTGYSADKNFGHKKYPGIQEVTNFENHTCIKHNNNNNKDNN